MPDSIVDPATLVGLAGVPVTTALVELLKHTVPIPSRFVPVAAIAVSLALNVAAGSLISLPIPTSLLTGLIAGLAASGLYSATRSIAQA